METSSHWASSTSAAQRCSSRRAGWGGKEASGVKAIQAVLTRDASDCTRFIVKDSGHGISSTMPIGEGYACAAPASSGGGRALWAGACRDCCRLGQPRPQTL